MNWSETRKRIIEYGIDAERLPEEWQYLTNLRHANLCYANLRHANLRHANLSDANLSGANLSGANLCYANLSGANLRNTDLRNANLRNTDLRNTDLRNTDLRDANLHNALLAGADLGNIRINYLTIGIHAAPLGDLICWAKKSGHIIKILVPADAPRSCATTRKSRAAWVKTLEIDGDVTRLEHSTEYGITIYEIGEITHADRWDENRWNECSHGIHFFLTKEEAEAW